VCIVYLNWLTVSFIVKVRVSELEGGGGVSYQHFFDLLKWPKVWATCCELGGCVCRVRGVEVCVCVWAMHQSRADGLLLEGNGLNEINTRGCVHKSYGRHYYVWKICRSLVLTAKSYERTAACTKHDNGLHLCEKAVPDWLAALMETHVLNHRIVVYYSR